MNSVFSGKFEFGLVGNVTYQQATYSLQSAQNNSFFYQYGRRQYLLAIASSVCVDK